MDDATKDKLKSAAKAHGPLAAVGAVALIALARGGSGSVPAPAPAERAAPSASAMTMTASGAKPAPGGPVDFAVRSCGKASRITGNARAGQVEIDKASNRDTCTVVLGEVVGDCSASLLGGPTSGHMLPLTYSSDHARIVVAGVKGGDGFVYACEAARSSK